MFLIFISYTAWWWIMINFTVNHHPQYCSYILRCNVLIYLIRYFRDKNSFQHRCTCSLFLTLMEEQAKNVWVLQRHLCVLRQANGRKRRKCMHKRERIFPGSSGTSFLAFPESCNVPSTLRAPRLQDYVPLSRPRRFFSAERFLACGK